jgi:hypothetical protein
MAVSVDNARHDRLTGKIHASRTWRSLHLSLLPDFADAIVLNQKGGVLDRSAAISRDEACTFKQDDATIGLRGTLLHRKREKQQKQQNGKKKRGP